MIDQRVGGVKSLQPDLEQGPRGSHVPGDSGSNVRAGVAWIDIEFAVRGLPIAQGTARAFVAGGKARIATDANRSNSPIGAWRGAIAAAAAEAMGQFPALDGPVTVTAYFVFPRPASHYLPANARRPVRELRLDAPRFVAGKPDIDKLARALLDGITNVVITDDSRVGGLLTWKVYEDDERRPGCQVSIRRLKTTR